MLTFRPLVVYKSRATQYTQSWTNE